MKTYDPNMTWGTHVVEVTIQQWDYMGHLKYECNGNCKGKEILDFSFFGNENETTESDCSYKYDNTEDLFSVSLKNSDGGTLEITGEAEEFDKMIVKIEMLDFIKI